MEKLPSSRDRVIKELKEYIRDFYLNLPKWLQILIISLLLIFFYEISLDYYNNPFSLPSLLEWITGEKLFELLTRDIFNIDR